MIIHIFNRRIYSSQKLSSTTSGMYPVYVDSKVVANIVFDESEWTIQLSADYSSRDVVLYENKPKLELYKIYIINNDKTGEQFYFVATPRYNPNTKSYDIPNQLSIGSHPDCDICYPLRFSNNDFLQISKLGNKFYVEANSPSFFIGDHRLTQKQEILIGDYIFYYGLKVIFLGTKIIVDNPVDQARIKPGLKPSAANGTDMPAIIPEEVANAPDDLPLYSEKDFFYKSPRLNYVIQQAVVEIDAPPEPDQGNDMPAILAVGPQITMAIASAISMTGLVLQLTSGRLNSVTIGISLGAMVITILGTLSWPLLRRRFNKKRIEKREAKRQKKYNEYLSKKKLLIDSIKAKQRQTLIENHPNPERCAEIVERKDRELWQRNVGHSDFLTVRVGVGKVPTNLEISKPKEQFSMEDDDSLFLAMKQVVDEALYIDDAPITYDLTEKNIEAIIGDDDSVKRFLDCMLLQILTFHSSSDLKVVVFTKTPNKWDYLKSTPHIWDAKKHTRYFTDSVEQLSMISTELEKVFDARAANDEEVQLEDDGAKHDSQPGYKDFRPYYLFFIDDVASVRNISLINKILRYKRNLGFSIIITAWSVSMLPSEASDFIFVSKQGSSITSGDTNDKGEDFAADFNDGQVDMSRYIQTLANIPVPVERDKFELPASLSFLELYECGRVEQLNSPNRWISNNPSVSLSVPIGVDQNSETFRMDIHEKAYGPHGLIAGTTGSGKSEWIITYILSLAANFSPDEVQFVLIDYKGGGLAKSFENSELGIKLPHLAGTITNLDKSEIFRSISAIESELKRRQAIFNAAREKLKESSMDIYKYQQYYRKGLVQEPLSHLLIICDEFAELKAQEPDFMDQLISTSRIGRALGVHLILATQKPSGVVNDQIWSNAKFKVCLKVQDRSDSNEILKKPDAAFLKTTGTFYLQVGNDDYSNLGQAAWAGAKYYPSDSVRHNVDNSVECIDNIGQIIQSIKSDDKQENNKESQGEELLNIVSYISKIGKQIPSKSRPIWLENIAPHILLSDLSHKYHHKPAAKFTYDTVIGEYDEPRRQEQGLLKVDLGAGNIAIIGRADYSIEKLISTIICSSIREHGPDEIAYYIIDFGTETLKKFAKFPQVGEVVFQDELDRVTGVLNLISEEMEKRKEVLSDYNGSFEYYNKTQPQKMHLIEVVINNFDIFGEILPRAIDLFGEFFRDGPRYGINFIVTANAINTLSSRQLQFFNHLILMQLNDDTQYRNITGCRRSLVPKKVVGRGICKIDADSADSYCEFQTAMIAPEEQELAVLEAYANKMVEHYKTKVKQLTKIPDDITSEDLIKYVSDLSRVPVGVDLYEKSVSTIDLLKQKLYLVTGKSIQDNLDFIYGLASILSKTQNVKVRVIDMLGIFKKPILDIKLFDDDDINVVFGALEKDVLTRTEAQDHGINIVLGAGQYKSYLSKGGIEIFQNLFEHLSASKKSTYILVDDYEKLRTLRLESWFADVDVSRGLWLGAGLANQSLITSETVRPEDKKHDFSGLAFNVEDGKYKVIKTIMDKDE